MKTILSTTRLHFYELTFTSIKLYCISALFIAGSIVLPYFCHQFYIGETIGGKIFLPIYFFILIGAYQFGWKVGLTTALCSPMMSYLLTGRPLVALLPIILIKSMLLVCFASVLAKKTRELSLYNLFLVVFGYQVIGTWIEVICFKNFSLPDFMVGYPGLVIQIVGSFIILKMLNRVLHEK